MYIAKLLMNGDSQTVILPQEFQFQGTEVYIKKLGSTIVLIPKENPREALFDSLSMFSDDFMENCEQTMLDIRKSNETFTKF